MSRRSKYTKEERTNIGRRIADHEFTIYTAAVEFGISTYTARDYLRIYKAEKKAGILKGE